MPPGHALTHRQGCGFEAIGVRPMAREGVEEEEGEEQEGGVGASGVKLPFFPAITPARGQGILGGDPRPVGDRGWGAAFVEEKVREEEQVTTAEAEEEYRRVFNESLEQNFDLAAATKAAKAAMRAALGIVDSSEEESEGEEGGEEEEEVFPPLGITIVTPPSSDGGKVTWCIWCVVVEFVCCWSCSDAAPCCSRAATAASCARPPSPRRWSWRPTWWLRSTSPPPPAPPSRPSPPSRTAARSPWPAGGAGAGASPSTPPGARCTGGGPTPSTPTR